MGVYSRPRWAEADGVARRPHASLPAARAVAPASPPAPMTNVLICLALLVFVGVLTLLNQFVKKARSEKRSPCGSSASTDGPDAPPHRSGTRRSRRRIRL